MDILSGQNLSARAAMLPQGTKVAHKTGSGARDCNDAGIIFQGDRPLFILTVYTERESPELADGAPYSPCCHEADRAAGPYLLRRIEPATGEPKGQVGKIEYGPKEPRRTTEGLRLVTLVDAR